MKVYAKHKFTEDGKPILPDCSKIGKQLDVLYLKWTAIARANNAKVWKQAWEDN